MFDDGDCEDLGAGVSATAEPPGSLAGSGAPTPEQLVRAIVLRRLAFSPRTRAELANSLIERGIPSEVGESVLDMFTDVGLIDDRAFALMWVTSRLRTKGKARPILAHELRVKGVSDDDAACALASITDENERERARVFVDRRLPSVVGLSYEAQQRRLMGLLTRRGYSTHVAFSIVRDVLLQLNQETL